MGLGIGGDYPLSATITSEFAATRIRGRMMTAVFASQGETVLLAPLRFVADDESSIFCQDGDNCRLPSWHFVSLLLSKTGL